MKKNICIILNLLIIHMYCFCTTSYSQTININQNINLKSEVTVESIKAHYFLPKWSPPPPEPPYLPKPVPPGPGPGPTPGPSPSPSPGGGGGNTPSNSTASSSGGGSGMAMAGVALGVGLPVVIGGSLLGLFLRRKKPPVTLPPVLGNINPTLPNTNNVAQSGFTFEFGEEILYYLAFENNQQNPIYSDSVLYIKLPAWLEYLPDSTTVNNVKLSDKADDDILTYFKDDSLLIMNIGATNKMPSISINFGAKVLTQSVSKSEAFCEVKFQSIQNNYSTDWNKMSVFPNKTLPPSLETILSNQ
ncbi:MAG: hypothetical protein AB7V50_09345 [Vampirovibrionia bacterium]